MIRSLDQSSAEALDELEEEATWVLESLQHLLKVVLPAALEDKCALNLDAADEVVTDVLMFVKTYRKLYGRPVQ